jgi:serine/threonine-protein kinase
MTEHSVLSNEAGRHAIVIGRYLLHRQIARGGMATIHIARLMGDEGFTRIVAAKRLHPEFAEDADFVAMFLDEARIASKVHHRNVVPVLDVVTTGDEVVLVQEYVHGAPLHWLLRTAHAAKTHVPINVAVSIGCQVLAGLHAAHETRDELGAPLGIVHRDVSPQNIMVSTDGTARLLDFGVAKASMSAHVTRDGTFKGKLAYSAPEQIRGKAVLQSDLYALSVVLWELLVGHRMHGSAQAEAELVGEIMSGSLPTITDALVAEREWLGENRWKQLCALEPIIQRGLATEVERRWRSAADMEAALATAVPPASTTGVAAWLKALGKEFLDGRDRMIALEEASWRRNNTQHSVARRLPTAPPQVVAPQPMPPPPSAPPAPPPLDTSPGIGPAPRLPALAGARRRIAIAASAAVVFGLVIGLVVTMKRSSSAEPQAAPERPTAMAPRPAPAPVPDPVPVPVPDLAPDPAPDPAPLAVAAAPAPPPAIATRAAATPRARAVRTAPPPTPPVRRAAPAPAPKPPASAPAPTPVVEAAPATIASPAADCNPPYYYEGQKKVFKPACL